MAGSVNKVILVGNLGSDPEVKYFDNGGAVANFSIATTESYTNKNGERIETTEWHRIELWEGLAKVAEKYLKRGSQIYIEGKIKTERYEKDGIEKSFIKIRANTMTMLGSPSSTPPNGITNGTPPNPAIRNNQPLTPEEDNDDLPF